MRTLTHFCSGGAEAHFAHVDANGECPWCGWSCLVLMGQDNGMGCWAGCECDDCRRLRDEASDENSVATCDICDRSYPHEHDAETVYGTYEIDPEEDYR